jgi:type II secretory pathway pseudopilin PulG
MKNISHKTQNTCVNCGAFTVVELLVMIGTIAVMGTLLMSAMAGVRPRGGVIQCLQNTRRIMLGMQMYASDWQDTLPNSGWDPLTPCWVTATGWPVGGSATALTFDVFLRGQLNFVRQGQLWPYMKTEKILMCPQDKVDTMFYNRGIYFSTYVWNGAVNQYASTPHWNACKISNASLKSTHIVQWENDEKLATPGSGNWIDCAN